MKSKEKSKKIEKIFYLIIFLVITLQLVYADSALNELENFYLDIDNVEIDNNKVQFNLNDIKTNLAQENKNIDLNLQYKSGGNYDSDNDGIETLKGVIDFTVENTIFNRDISSYKEYDEILLIESKGTKIYYYNYCRNLDSKGLDNAVHLEIVKTKTSETYEKKEKIITTSNITKGRDISECDRVIGLQKDGCISTFAIGTGDVEFCELILDPSYKYSCYSGIASTYGNLSICNKIPEGAGTTKDYCMANTARTLRDKTICDGIKDE